MEGNTAPKTLVTLGHRVVSFVACFWVRVYLPMSSRNSKISEFLKKMFLNKKIPHSDSKSNYHSPKTVIFKKSPKKNVGSNRKKLNAKRCLDHFVVIQVRTYIIRGLNISGVSWRWFCFSENKDDAFPTDKQVAMQGLFMGPFKYDPPFVSIHLRTQIIMESHGPSPQKVV